MQSNQMNRKTKVKVGDEIKEKGKWKLAIKLNGREHESRQSNKMKGRRSNKIKRESESWQFNQMKGKGESRRSKKIGESEIWQTNKMKRKMKGGNQ